MDVASLIRLIRRRITEVDPGTSTYSDPDLLSRAADAAMLLKTLKVKGYEATVIALSPPTITPELTDELGVILAYRTAVDILTDEFQERLKNHELGVSWKSGLEEESSHTAAKIYQDRITGITAELNTMILVQLSANSATRAQ